MSEQKPKLRGLSLYQPWATLLAYGSKKIETRSWKPRDGERPNLIAVHSSKRWTEEEIETAFSEPFRTELRDRCGYAGMAIGDLPLGKILAVGELVGIVKTEIATIRLTDLERSFGNYSPGRFAWIMGRLLILREPYPIRGMPGLWELPGDLERKLLELWREKYPENFQGIGEG